MILPERWPKAPEWSLKDFIPVAPFVAGAFAFAYVVGYFLAFDISWFPFFSLSEHIVFALRALPIAIGLSFVFLVAFKSSETLTRVWLNRLLYYFFAPLYFVLGVFLYLYNHAGMTLTLWLVAVGIVLYGAICSIRTPFVTILLAAANMMIVIVGFGWISGAAWWFRPLSWSMPFSDSRAMIIRLKTETVDVNKSDGDKNKPNNEEYIMGHVIFAGTDNVLFYEFERSSHPGETHLYRWDAIKEIFQCSGRHPSAFDCMEAAKTSSKRQWTGGG